ncbi:unnamed protein product [Allacma fusca]|uniref:Uncharacterized protein n=1 Tax=Allacma fusca TaxID=39272 RepID=A0A8J2KAC9_9HEXA|nr:unnamed protein product [Allacma fusca]
MFPILVPTVAARNTNFENGTTSSSLEEPPVETRMRLLSSEFTEISYSSPENSATPDYSQIETEISDGVRTDSYEDGDGGADSLREGSTNSMKTIKSSSSCTKSSTPDRSHPRNRNHQSFFKHRTGSDADDESCDSQSTDIPLRLSSTRLKSKTTLTKRHQRLKRRSSSTKRNGSFPKIKSSSKESSNRKNSNQTRADARSDTENTIPELKSDDDTMSPLHRSESDLIRLRNFQLNESAEDENEYENSLPDTLFGTESPEETVQCGTSEYNRASKGSQAEGSLITPLPSLESKLDNRIDSSPEGSNQTVIMRGNKTPEIIYNMKSSSSQPSVERIFFKAADVEPLVRRRPARTRPKTTGCVEDSVAMWEGIQINHSDQILIGDEEEITFQNIPRPPTRRRSCTRDSEGRRLRMNSTSTKSKADKKQTIKTINAKIQNLISNVNRVGELHREKLQTEGKKLKEIKLNQRPQTSPPMNPIPKLPTWIEKTSRNRPSTSVPSSPAESTSQKSNGLSSKTKNPRSKRSLSQSATPRADPTSWNVTSRPVTATAVRFSTRSKPNSMTVRTTFVDNNNPTKPSEIHGKTKQEGKVPKKLPSHKSADEEPLELLFSFKTNKSPPKRTLSPVGLAPQHNQMDQASLYKHIEIHRRQALCEAQKVLAKKRSLLRKIEKDLTDTSTSALSSPLSSPKRVVSANNFHRPYNNTNNKPQQTKKLLKELSNQVHLEKSFEMTRKLAKMKDKVKSKSANTSNNPAEKCFVPLPMSKRVHFSSPIQTKLPRVKLSVNTSKQQKAKSQSQQTSAPRSRSQTPTLDNNYTISFNTPTYPPAKVKVSVRKVPKQVTRKAQDINEGEDEDTDGDGNDGDTATNASSHWSLSETNIDQSENDDDTNDNILERLEGLRDKIRGKEFERRKRGKGDQDPNKKGPVYSSLSLYLPKRKKSEKMIDMKIIVRRKTKDGKFPSLDDAVGHLSSKCTYLIVDEEPLTKSGPNPYLEAQMKQAKPKGTAVPTLKITTSEASTIESLPSEEALTRFLTCYVCGQTLNIRDYFSHERKCVHNIHKNNQYLADEDKRILPQKPQGTITIKHWNTFAHESIKNKLIRCPYCEMEFFPDHPEDANFHKETCTNRPLPSVAPPRGLNLTDHYTVLMAEEAQGWVVPTTKELHRNNWTPGYSRVEQYTRPAENRVRKYKKPKLVVQESSTQIGKKKKKIAP